MSTLRNQLSGGRNIDVLIDGVRRPSTEPAPDSALREAMRRRQEMVAIAIDDATASQVTEQANLDRLRLEAERIELEEKIEEARRRREEARQAPPPEAQGGGMMGELVGMLMAQTAEARAEAQRAQAMVFEELRGQMQATQAELVAMREGAGRQAEPPKTLLEQAAELHQVRLSLAELFPTEQPQVPASISEATQAIEFLRIKTENDRALAELAMRQKREEDGLALQRMSLTMQQKRNEALAGAVQQIGPPLVEAFGKFVAERAGDALGAPAEAGAAMVAFECPQCHGPVQTEQEATSAVCPHCHVMLGLRGEDAPPPATPPVLHLPGGNGQRRFTQAAGAAG